MKVQVTIIPSEAKRLIAKAVSQMSVVRAALRNGRILLKGGTTVSAVAEELVGTALRISGRITPQGTKYTDNAETLHRVLLENGELKSLDTDSAIDELATTMGRDDVVIIGANALDTSRRAAVMVGHPWGGPAARLLPSLWGRGVPTIIPVGWEKLIPSMEEALAVAGRETTDLAMGMAVGLVPLRGTVVTETDAVNMLTGAKNTVIGAGGITGGEGSTSFVIEGELSQVKKAWEIIQSVKGAEVSGVTETLFECNEKSPQCARYLMIGDKRIPMHRACNYREPGLAAKIFCT
jgi:hypothetical protein